jgi:biofilm protein TabA
MIYCPISDLKRYITLSPNIKTAVTFILATNFNNLPFGKTVVDGDKVYLNKNLVELSDESETFEVHKKYIDIHIDLEDNGSTSCECIESAYKNLIITKPYEEEEDYELLTAGNLSDGDEHIKIILFPGFCAVYLTNEAHKPNLTNNSLLHGIKGSIGKLVKCVVKVLDDTNEMEWKNE